VSGESGPPTFEPDEPVSPPASGLRARLKLLNTSRLGEALAERNGDQADDAAGPSSREISPELVLVDPALAAWARKR
jgi:hypothetical protein